MNNYFNTKVYEVPIFYTWSALATVIVPLYGFLLSSFTPDSIEYMSHRFLISFYWGIVFICSFKSESIRKKWFIPLCYLGNVCTTIWIIWIVYINQFSANYCIGLFTTFAAFGYMYRNYTEIIGYYFFSSIIIAFFYYKTPNPELDGVILWLSIAVIFLTTLVIMIQKFFFSRNLNSLIQELSVKNDELKQFAYITSHDLKSPLVTIKSLLSMLNKKIEKQDYEGIGEINGFLSNCIDKGIGLVDDLLTYSVLRETEISFEETNIDVLVNDLIQTILLNHKEQKIEINIPQALPTKLICNKRQMVQLFQNLIENGLKYNRSNIKKIIITVAESKKKYNFKIKDNGIGISKEFQNQIFDLFKRLHSDGEFKGTGIGLSICKKIVENHQGEITVESMEEGAVFNFSIPKVLKM